MDKKQSIKHLTIAALFAALIAVFTAFNDSIALVYAPNIDASEDESTSVYTSGVLVDNGYPDGWADEAYKTITIPTDQEASTEFAEWFSANAAPVVEHTVSGVWKFKDVLTPCDAMVSNATSLNFTFTLLEPTEESTARAYEYIAPYVEQMENGELSEEELKSVMMKFYRIALENATEIEAIGTAIGMDGGYSLEYGYIVDGEETGRYVYGTEEGWKTYELGDGIKTIDFGTEPQTVSTEFYSWLTANASQPCASITHNGEAIASLFAGQTATLKCAGMKMAGDVVVSVAENIGGVGDANIVPLIVGDVGTYDANSPVIVTETFTGGTPDITIRFPFLGTLPYFKAKNLVATESIIGLVKQQKVNAVVGGDVYDASNMEFTFGSNNNYVAASTGGVPTLIWLIATDDLEFTKEAGFEDGAVYLLDLWSAVGFNGDVSVTALGMPDKPADGFMPVEVALPVVDGFEITPKYQETQNFFDGNLYRNITVHSPPLGELTVTPSFEKQTFNYGGTEAYGWVYVEPIDLSQTKLLCDIEISTLPKTDYVLGEGLDASGLVIICHYTDGSVMPVSLGNNWVGGYSGVKDTVGKHKLYVELTENGITCRTFYEITIREA